VVAAVTPEFRRFHNALRIMLSIDRHELPPLSPSEWFDFSRDPYRFYIAASDANKAAIWSLIESRQT
jgi:hypothetical protein